MVNAPFVTDFAEIRRYQDRSLRTRARRIARGAALDVLSAASAMIGDDSLSRPRVHVLCLHHVFEDEEQRFRRLLERLMQQHTFISYSDAIARVSRGEIDRPFISLSFDDGLRNDLRVADILREFGLSACFFVCDSMAEPRSYEAVREFCARELTMPPAEFLTWSDMERLLAAGHEIGNHGRNHRVLATLDGAALDEEIGASLESLRRRLGDIRHFAWARGRWPEFSAAAKATVFRTGHVSCASAMRGCHLPGAPRDTAEICIRREHVVAADPLRHTLYFLRKSSSSATEAITKWPDGWNVAARAGT